MKITKSINYAIHILRCLHEHSYINNNRDVLTAEAITEAVGMSYPFFVKTAHQLKRQGLLSTVQGRNGGYQIAKHGDEISVYDVFIAMEGELEVTRNLDNDGAPCAVLDYFRGLQTILTDSMASKKISDLDTTAYAG